MCGTVQLFAYQFAYVVAILLLGVEGGSDGSAAVTEGENLVAHRFLLAFHQLHRKLFPQKVLPHRDRKSLPLMQHSRMILRQSRILTNTGQASLVIVLVADLVHFEFVFLFGEGGHSGHVDLVEGHAVPSGKFSIRCWIYV